ncbi:hypothetical protein ACKWTF_015773 [Chironomus riparius]
MSRKISDFFKVEPKSSGTKINNQMTAETENSLNLRECRVKLDDIRNDQKISKIKLFDEILTKNKSSTKFKDYKCNICGKKLSTNQNLKRHIENIHQISAFGCTICSNSFMTQKYLNQHIKTEHLVGKNEYFECDFDGKIFNKKTNFVSHMNLHLSLVKCEICHKMISVQYIYNHRKNVHAIDCKYQCKICLKSFKSINYLRYHKKIHDKKYKCEICDKKFIYQGLLKTHVTLFHESEKSFECKICNKKFNLQVLWKKHQKVHEINRSKPFKCEKCDFATDNKRYFEKHQIFHNRQDKKFLAMKNPLQCEKCKIFCRDSKALNGHKLNVHPKVLFQCDLCAKFIKVKKSVISHMKVHFLKN